MRDALVPSLILRGYDFFVFVTLLFPRNDTLTFCHPDAERSDAEEPVLSAAEGIYAFLSFTVISAN